MTALGVLTKQNILLLIVLAMRHGLHGSSDLTGREIRIATMSLKCYIQLAQSGFGLTFLHQNIMETKEMTYSKIIVP